MKNNIDAIIFDLGGVILNLDYQLTINAFQCLTSLRVEEVYSQANQSNVFDDFETGKIGSSEFRARLSKMLQMNVSDTDFDQAWNAMLLDLPIERIELLEQLGKGYRIFLFSNTNEIHFQSFQKGITEKYGEMNLFERVFEQTYYSHTHGERKPDAIAFEKILKEQKLEAATTLFIDDSVQHIEGAQKLGIQTVHLQNIDILEACKPLLKSE